MKKIIFTFISTILLSTVFAANDDAHKLLQKIQAFYKAPAFMQLNMTYTYADIASPEIIKDSLYGHISVSRNKYRLFIDSAETIANDQHVIQLLHREKIIVMAKRPSGNLNAGLPDTFIDSVFLKASTCLRLTAVADSWELKISFQSGSAYNSVTLLVNPSTGFIHKVIYEVRTEELQVIDASQQNNENPLPEYSLVTVTYSKCTTESFDTGIFENSRFVLQDQNNLSPATDYAGYTIYNTTLKQ